MTDELGDILPQATPRRASPHLRVKVLAAVDRELKRRRKPRWERIFELSAAACLALGIGLNLWNPARDRSLPDGIDRQATNDESGTGAGARITEPGHLAEAQHWPLMSEETSRRYQAILRELSNPLEGTRL